VGASPLVPGEKLRAEALLEQTFVRDVMRTKLVTVQEGELLVTAAQTMRDKKLGCLPVVNDDFELVGIVTASDLLALAIRFLGGE
jgi:acetoin utilization protein AcuB